MGDPWFHFLLGLLATWRITHLLAYEDGPWDVVVRLRAALGDGFWGSLVDCFKCLSLWVAIPFALLFGRGALEIGLSWLALSGGACLLDRLGRDPVLFQALGTEGDHDELLRRQTERAAEDSPGERQPEQSGVPPPRADA